jgi:hypothetical protein
MTTTDFIAELEAMPGEKRRATVKTILGRLYPESQRAIDRMLRRMEHPEVPEDVWEGFEEAEDGRGIEMRDEHFTDPPA